MPTQAALGMKSALVDTMFEILSATEFRLVIANGFWSDAPTAAVPNDSARGAITIGPAIPLPLRLAVCGLFAALSEIITMALPTPSAPGTKVSATLHR